MALLRKKELRDSITPKGEVDKEVWRIRLCGESRSVNG
jgi:hypothetical protein